MLLLAWRNIWRNKRRTLITAASIGFAVFFSILFRGFEIGTWNRLIDNILHSYTGYIQIHARGYWQNKTLDYTIPQHDANITTLNLNENGTKQLIPRLESTAWVSSSQKTKVVIIIGIDPLKEMAFSKLDKKIVTGNYLTHNEKAILVSERLANFLHIKTGDSLVLISKGYRGNSAVGLYKINGIVKLPSPEFDNQMIFMPLAFLQDFYAAPNLITSWVVDIDNNKKMNSTIDKLATMLPISQYEVMTWHEMLSVLYQQYKTYESGSCIILMLLYILVGFGIFGTIMMTLSERKYEVGIMIAMGMNKFLLLQSFFIELLVMGFIGIVLGIVCSLPILFYYQHHPIMFTGEMAKVCAAFGLEPFLPVAIQSQYIVQQAINVTIITLFALIYPCYSLIQLNVPKVLKKG